MSIQAISGSAPVSLTAKIEARATSESTSSSKNNQSDAPKAASSSEKPAPAASSPSKPVRIYDRRDSNQDGIVSYQEEILYSMQYPLDEIQNKPTVANSQLQSALRAYQKNQ